MKKTRVAAVMASIALLGGLMGIGAPNAFAGSAGGTMAVSNTPSSAAATAAATTCIPNINTKPQAYVRIGNGAIQHTTIGPQNRTIAIGVTSPTPGLAYNNCGWVLGIVA